MKSLTEGRLPRSLFSRGLPLPALLLALFLGGWNGAQGQEAGGTLVFASEPIMDLWLHGMALVDPVGPGPHPLYDTGYPSEVRRVKEERGVFPTPLDQSAGHFRDAFRSDPSFEVLHFLPLYFAGAGRTEVFRALETVAMAPSGIPQASSERTALGVVAVGSVLNTQSQRALLGEFLAALSAEWNIFFQAHWQAGLGEANRINRALRDHWQGRYEPVLGPLLNGLGMERGFVALSPAIGNEGRVFGGLPQDPTDDVIVVARPSGTGRTQDAVYSILREISFPMVRQAMESWGESPQSREEGERLAAIAAVRSGALIIESYLPEETVAYKSFFLSRAGRIASEEEAVDEVFQGTFALDSALERALREQIISTVNSGGIE